ncbi:DUF6318 family protein [Janibacter alittae]|uniref:DUF6318 family protein n=1 Tax=Janibacter alittae TaxID=3115209 RepID=A0ABZ2MKQ5_9MICO
MVALAATVLAMGALSACGGESDAEPSTATSTASPLPVDPSSSSSSSSGEASSTSSTKGGEDSVDLPQAATKHTQEGAVAFAKFYWDETGRALQSGETAALESMATDCVPCAAYVESVEEDAKKGLHADVNPTVIGDHKIAKETDGKSAQAVRLSVRENAYQVVDGQGQAQAQADPVSYDVLIYLDESQSGWTVVDLYMFTK